MIGYAKSFPRTHGDEPGYVKEVSLTEKDSMANPNFVFVFTSIKKYSETRSAERLPSGTMASLPKTREFKTFNSAAIERLKEYAGKYTDEEFYRIIKIPLTNLLGQEKYESVVSNLAVHGPIHLEGDELILTGNFPHQGGSEQAIISINITKA